MDRYLPIFLLKIFFLYIFLKIYFQITKEEILTVMTNLGVEVSEENLDKRMKEFDKDHDGIVEFSEFVYLMKDVLVDTKDDRLAEYASDIFWNVETDLQGD